MEGGPDPDDHDASPYGGAGGEPPAPQRATTPDWPLTGRESELRSLCDMVLSGDRRTVVVAGPTGVGKTRLGHECLAAAARADRDTVRMIATRSAAPLPFGAVAPLLHLVTSGEGGGPGEDGVDVLRRSVAALASRLDGRDLILFVDDAHLLDDASAALVHQVATTGAATVLATVRTGEPAPDAVVALWKDGPAERLELGGLTRSSIESLLTAVLGGPVDPAALIELTERSQGNILFLRELVNGALDDGSLVGDDGIWRLRRELSPSARLVEIVEASFGELDDDERALLELVAHGEPLGHAELASLSDPAVAEALERRGLLTSRVDGRRLQIRLAHPIYGDVLRSRTPALRARAVARSLAEVAERTRLRRHEDILRVANWHLLDGGGHPDRLLDAANIARGRHDLALAERLARAAVERGAGPDAALLAAHLAGQQGRRSEAEQQLAVLASDAGPDAQRGRAAVARFDNALARTGGDAVDALAGMSHGATDTSWREVFESRRLALVLDSEGPRAAARAATELAAQADGEALAVSCVIGAHSLVRLGDLDRAFALADRGEAAPPLTTRSPGTRGGTWPPAAARFSMRAGSAMPTASSPTTTPERSTRAVPRPGRSSPCWKPRRPTPAAGCARRRAAPVRPSRWTTSRAASSTPGVVTSCAPSPSRSPGRPTPPPTSCGPSRTWGFQRVVTRSTCSGPGRGPRSPRATSPAHVTT